MADLRIDVDGHELTAEWTGANPTTRDAVAASLPLEGEGVRWGEELYFGIGVDVPAEDARTEVPVGSVAYWPQGNALCLFWGATPASKDEEPRAASPVNVVAEIDDVDPLDGVEGGARIRIERAEE